MSLAASITADPPTFHLANISFCNQKSELESLQNSVLGSQQAWSNVTVRM